MRVIIKDMFWETKKDKIVTDSKKIEDILTRSIAEILPTKDGLREALKSGKRLRIYIGTDATGTSLHLGHATNYMILEKLRRLGHEVIFLIGDFTARIGDPTDKSDSERKQLTHKQVIENVKTWVDQVRPVIDIDNRENPVKIKYNDDWLSSLTFEDVINLASNFTVQQMIERDMFQVRIKAGKPLYLHEMFYPLMQGYDSVAMNVDVEVCGTDQKFNALAGRKLLRNLKNKEKFILITTLLENPITGEKMMSKSIGTGVFLDFDANQMYGSLMAQADENMKQLFIDTTWLTLEEIDEILQVRNPRDAKMRLAKEIVSIYHGEKKAKNAEENFTNTFSKGGVPDDILEIKVADSAALYDAISTQVKSKSELRRLVENGAISIVGGETIKDINFKIEKDMTLKIGKRRFLKVKIK